MTFQPYANKLYLTAVATQLIAQTIIASVFSFLSFIFRKTTVHFYQFHVHLNVQLLLRKILVLILKLPVYKKINNISFSLDVNDEIRKVEEAHFKMSERVKK